ncbi:hypothetical protein [Nonomuraea sp. NPDC048826]|uniref:hypothetical protein n=1 Tax=Nonomuraea sp. NPDC048826 TaxID=3364347 RepID=UPI0037191041
MPMAPEVRVKVRYKRAVSIPTLVAGVLVILAGIWLCATGTYDAGIPALVAGVVLTGIGATYLGLMPYFVVTDSEVVVPMMRGDRARTTLKPGERLAVHENRLVVVRPGQRTPVPVYRGMAHPDDWNALTTALAQNHPDQQRP